MYLKSTELLLVVSRKRGVGETRKISHDGRYLIAFLLISLWCNFSVKPSLSPSAAQRDQSHGLIWFNPKLIRQRQHEGGVHICAPLCPPAQRWQMCPPQWKYWELLGHLSGNIWAIWKITFCKWTQIKIYAVPFPCAGSIAGWCSFTQVLSWYYVSCLGLASCAHLLAIWSSHIAGVIFTGLDIL